LRRDDHQKGIIRQLMRLYEDLKEYDPGPLPPAGDVVEPSFVRPATSH